MLRLSEGARMEALEAPAYFPNCRFNYFTMEGPSCEDPLGRGHRASPLAPQPQSLFVVLVPLPPVSEMRLPRPWPPVFQGPHDDLHDGHREQDGRREQRQLQHIGHRIGMDRVATSRKTSAQGGRGTTRLQWTG